VVKVKWEYAQLLFERALRDDGVWETTATFHPPNGEKRVLEATDTIGPVAHLVEFGSEGWELVTLEVSNGVFRTTAGQDRAHWLTRRFWLKRPVA
jgi:hypothetical protein